MQRNSTLKKTLNAIVWLGVFFIYSTLATIYHFLPPMIAPLFLLFLRAIKKEDLTLLSIVIIAIFILEVQQGFLAFSLLIFFILLEKFIIPKIDQSFNVESFKLFLYVILVYFGYFLFATLLSQIFLLPMISFSYYIIYYILIEYLIVRVLAS